jgi:hypothetical protein
VLEARSRERTYLWLRFEAKPSGGEDLAVVVGHVCGHLGGVSGLDLFLDGMVLCWFLSGDWLSRGSGGMIVVVVNVLVWSGKE